RPHAGSRRCEPRSRAAGRPVRSTDSGRPSTVPRAPSPEARSTGRTNGLPEDVSSTAEHSALGSGRARGVGLGRTQRGSVASEVDGAGALAPQAEVLAGEEPLQPAGKAVAPCAMPATTKASRSAG